MFSLYIHGVGFDSHVASFYNTVSNLFNFSHLTNVLVEVIFPFSEQHGKWPVATNWVLAFKQKLYGLSLTQCNVIGHYKVQLFFLSTAHTIHKAKTHWTLCKNDWLMAYQLNCADLNESPTRSSHEMTLWHCQNKWKIWHLSLIWSYVQ